MQPEYCNIGLREEATRPLSVIFLGNMYCSPKPFVVFITVVVPSGIELICVYQLSGSTQIEATTRACHQNLA